MVGVPRPASDAAAPVTPAQHPPQSEAEVSASGDHGPPGTHPWIHFRSLSDAYLFTFIISGPATLWESLWRGRPMIDQPGNLWIVPTVIVILTFLVGGAIAGRRRQRPMGAVIQALALSIPVATVLILIDVARRLIVNIPMFTPVIELWIDAFVGAIIIAVLGALGGRWLHLRRRRRSAPTMGTTLSRYARDGG
ncbi:MAG TPA: hypothetical protein VG412_13780 [Acidimicrobiales bacterium]|nr:hypothetical protein [Acidimicrobiales bacterium]